MAGDAFYIHADFHAASVASVDTAVGGLGGNDEFGTYMIFFNDILPAETVAVFFLYGSGNQNLIFVVQKAEILHDLCAVYRGNDAAQLIGGSASADLGFSFVALIGIKFPVDDISDSDSIDMCVKGDQLFAAAHIAKDIAHGIDLYLVEADLFHFFLDAHDMSFFAAAFTGDRRKVTKELCHFLLISFCCLLNLCIIQAHDGVLLILMVGG